MVFGASSFTHPQPLLLIMSQKRHTEEAASADDKRRRRFPNLKRWFSSSLCLCLNASRLITGSSSMSALTPLIPCSTTEVLSIAPEGVSLGIGWHSEREVLNLNSHIAITDFDAILKLFRWYMGFTIVIEAWAMCFRSYAFHKNFFQKFFFC